MNPQQTHKRSHDQITSIPLSQLPTCPPDKKPKITHSCSGEPQANRFQITEENAFNDLEQRSATTTSIDSIINSAVDELAIALHAIFSSQASYTSTQEYIEQLLALPQYSNPIKIRLLTQLSTACNMQRNFEGTIKVVQKGLTVPGCTNDQKIILLTELSSAYGMLEYHRRTQEATSQALALPECTNLQKIILLKRLGFACYYECHFDNAKQTALSGLSIPECTDIDKIIFLSLLFLVNTFQQNNQIETLTIFLTILDVITNINNNIDKKNTLTILHNIISLKEILIKLAEILVSISDYQTKLSTFKAIETFAQLNQSLLI